VPRVAALLVAVSWLSACDGPAVDTVSYACNILNNQGVDDDCGLGFFCDETRPAPTGGGTCMPVAALTHAGLEGASGSLAPARTVARGALTLDLALTSREHASAIIVVDGDHVATHDCASSAHLAARSSAAIDAVALLRRGVPIAYFDAAIVRHGEKRAEVTASFQVNRIPTAQAWLAERDLDQGDDCILRRTVSAEGRSRTRSSMSAVQRSVSARTSASRSPVAGWRTGGS